MERKGRAAAAALLTVLFPAAAWAAGPLDTEAQRRLDDKALAVRSSPALVEEAAAAARILGADPWAATAEGRAALPGVIDEVAFSAAVGVVDRDPARPEAFWVWAPAHTWHGVSVPAAKVLMPNADNVFRIVPVDGRSRYRIDAVPSGPRPVQFTVQLLPGLPGEGNWHKVLQEVLDSDLDIRPDGSFSLTVGPEAAAGRRNHIGTGEAARFLLIRDTIADWGRESPYHLTVTRIEGPPAAPPPSDSDLARDAAALLHQTVEQIGQLKAQAFFKAPPNTLSPPKEREGGRWGLSSAGHFHLAADEALVFTLDPGGARYLAVQLANPLLGGLDYPHRTASLNLPQTRPNPDGSVTFVLAPTDPGVANWLDTTGLLDGTLFVRWQQLPHTGPVTAGVRSIALVKRADLDSALPAGVPRVSDAERQAQRAERARAYAHRFRDTP